VCIRTAQILASLLYPNAWPNNRWHPYYYRRYPDNWLIEVIGRPKRSKNKHIQPPPAPIFQARVEEPSPKSMQDQISPLFLRSAKKLRVLGTELG
jgi:hypothetical protein